MGYTDGEIESLALDLESIGGLEPVRMVIWPRNISRKTISLPEVFMEVEKMGFKTKEERFYNFSRGDFTGEINGLSVCGNPVQIGLLRENLGKKFPGLRFHVVE
jgi:hypothetical protein